MHVVTDFHTASLVAVGESCCHSSAAPTVHGLHTRSEVVVLAFASYMNAVQREICLHTRLLRTPEATASYSVL